MVTAHITTVLVVDEDLTIDEAIVDGLNSQGFDAFVVETPEHVLSALVTETIDVLVIHGHVPGSGRSLGFAAQMSTAFPHTAIVAVSNNDNAAYAFPPSRVSVLRQPFGLKDLLAAIVEAEEHVGKIKYPKGVK
jgi:DNA-binding NtrC family response regulator